MSRTYRDSSGSGSKWEKKFSSHRERMLEREYCNKVKLNQDEALVCDIEAKDPMWGTCWGAYWRPLRRWLNSHVGQPWNRVYSELVAKVKSFASFRDEQSIRQHILWTVEVTPDPSRNRYYCVDGDPNTSCREWDFYVDDAGLLQKKKYIRRGYSEKIPFFRTETIAKWLNGRVVGRRGNNLYWFVPVAKGKKHGRVGHDKWKCAYWYGRGLTYYCYESRPIYGVGYKIVGNKEGWVSSVPGTLRQSKQFTSEDIAFWNSIPEFYQKQMLEFSPLEEKRPNHSYCW